MALLKAERTGVSADVVSLTFAALEERLANALEEEPLGSSVAH